MRKEIDELFEKRKREILETKDSLDIRGTTYYVSNDGDDGNDGTSPDSPWKTLKRVSTAYLYNGDGVLFKRGDVFRGTVATVSGVSYGAYGTGDKPKLYGSEMSLADPKLWEQYDKEHHIWKCKKKFLDPGTLVFNGGEVHSRKLIPSYKNLQFVCRYDESKPFVISDEMTNDLDLFWHYDKLLTRVPSNGEDFPIPMVWGGRGDIYLRCDKGNPGAVFSEIEMTSANHMFFVQDNTDVTIDNICIKYVGRIGVKAGIHSVGLHVTNCEFGWIGGVIQHYDGTDPNYPEGGRGTVTRYGNGVEVYGGCEDYIVSNNYFYQIYDAAITHQVTTDKKVVMADIRYSGNLIEKCVYGIEYFLDLINGESESIMENIVICDNFIRNTGYGWGQQRHNSDTPSAIKSWNFANIARNFKIHNNIFDRSQYRLLHLSAQKDEYCPVLYDNTYIQNCGGMLGQYGANSDILIFDEDNIRERFGDKTARVLEISEG